MKNKINFTAFDFETATYDKFPCQLGIVIPDFVNAPPKSFDLIYEVE